MSDSDLQTPTPAAPAPTRAEIVKQIAHTLIQKRKERDLTLEKVSQIIQIRLPYLQSIEKGTWDELPGEVYVRGFIKRYADFLGLDPAALMATYIASSAPVIEEKPSANTPLSADMNRLQFLWIGLIGIFVVVFIKLIQKERTAPLKPVAVAVSSVTATVPVVPVVVAPATVAPAVVLPKHTLDVFSPYPLWLRVTAANKNFEGFIPQSASWTWRGEGTFVVRFGHTKQVALSFDGQPVALTEDQKSVTLPHAN